MQLAKLKFQDGVIGIYQKVMVFVLSAHLFYTVLFATLNMPILLINNIISTVIYSLTYYIASKGYFRTVVITLHIEISLFVTCGVICVGWDTGIQLFMLALVSLTYFNPFQHRKLIYLMSVAEILLFILLNYYADTHAPIYPLVHDWHLTLLYAVNASGSFISVLIVSVLCNLDAKVGRQALIKENIHLSNLANYDQMTALLNRRAFQQSLDRAKGRQDVIIAMGDIDNFKMVNDTYGHATGDRIIRAVADQLRCCCGEHAEICRWGGEEFILLFVGISEEQARTLLELARRQFGEEIFFVHGRRLRKTFTMGYALSTEVDTIDELIELADHRLYIGKNKGKNCIVGPEGSNTQNEIAE